MTRLDVLKIMQEVFNETYVITLSRDRMGYTDECLDAKHLKHVIEHMISEEDRQDG